MADERAMNMYTRVVKADETEQHSLMNYHILMAEDMPHWRRLAVTDWSSRHRPSLLCRIHCRCPSKVGFGPAQRIATVHHACRSVWEAISFTNSSHKKENNQNTHALAIYNKWREDLEVGRYPTFPIVAISHLGGVFESG